MATVDSNTVRLLNVANDSCRLVSEASVEEPRELNAGAWDPHNTNEFTVACDTSLQQWDVRAFRCVGGRRRGRRFACPV